VKLFKTRKLKIGYQTYTFKENTDVLKELGICARCHKDNQRIEYRTDFPASEVADSVIHEVLHAIVHSYIYDVDGADEEETVTMIAHGLTQVIRDNPKFWKELTKMLIPK
tara:strand:- start:16209 stop:16538 length:330 start_codon:yes stop_codon:yes gene_type:complete